MIHIGKRCKSYLIITQFVPDYTVIRHKLERKRIAFTVRFVFYWCSVIYVMVNLGIFLYFIYSVGVTP